MYQTEKKSSQNYGRGAQNLGELQTVSPYHWYFTRVSCCLAILCHIYLGKNSWFYLSAE